jgi:hypothetical protein
MAAQPPPAIAPGPAAPALPAPLVPHNFTRVTLPAEDNTLDYVAIGSSATVVRGLPKLGWVDSSVAIANTMAAPLLSIAGCLCLAVFAEDVNRPVARALLALADLLAVPTLALLNRCADACDMLRLFSVPLLERQDWVDKLVPALARIPSPSPFLLGAGELVEANAFATAAIPAVAAVPARAAIPAVRRNRARGILGAARVPAVDAADAIVLDAAPATPALASPPPDLTPLTSLNACGRRVLVPARVWPSYPCDEHDGRGWEAIILRNTQRAATVRFLHATTPRGMPYEDAQLQLCALHPL